MTFTNFPEIEVASVDEETGEVVIATTAGAVLFKTVEYRNESEFSRFVECWNALRKIAFPHAHLNATEEYVKRLEQLRKDAVSPKPVSEFDSAFRSIRVHDECGAA